MDHPVSLPPLHRDFLERVLPLLAANPRILAIAAGGSYAADVMDEFSDLDIVLVCESADVAGLLQERAALAQTLGPLVAAFTGEHVGEPRLLICLYGPPALHVDFKVVTLDELGAGAGELEVLWDPSGRLSDALMNAGAKDVQGGPDAQWLEDRFWVWVHYGALKIGRGELQEAFDFLSYLRVFALGPLGLHRSGMKPYGVRRVEKNPQLARRLGSTIGQLEPKALFAALENATNLYLELRPAAVRQNAEAQRVALEFFNEVCRRFES